jgi:hypothetical protein
MINNFLCVAVKIYAFLERDTISPIKSQISNILIPNNFPQLKQLKFSQELTNKPLDQVTYPPPIISALSTAENYVVVTIMRISSI